MRLLRRKQKAAQANYATSADFCHIFEKEMQPLYLLAFLLTANHADAEKCFVGGLEDAGTCNAVFRDWARFWARRAIIKNAIRIMSLASNETPGLAESWDRAWKRAASAANGLSMCEASTPSPRVMVSEGRVSPKPG